MDSNELGSMGLQLSVATITAMLATATADDIPAIIDFRDEVVRRLSARRRKWRSEHLDAIAKPFNDRIAELRGEASRAVH